MTACSDDFSTDESMYFGNIVQQNETLDLRNMKSLKNKELIMKIVCMKVLCQFSIRQRIQNRTDRRNHLTHSNNYVFKKVTVRFPQPQDTWAG